MRPPTSLPPHFACWDFPSLGRAMAQLFIFLHLRGSPTPRDPFPTPSYGKPGVPCVAMLETAKMLIDDALLDIDKKRARVVSLFVSTGY